MSTATDPNTLVEVTAGELAALRNSRNLLQGLYGNKETATPFKRMLKKVNPELKIPDLEMAEEFAEPLQKDIATLREQNGELIKRLDAREPKDKERDELTDVYGKIDAVVRKRGLTDEGRAGLIKTMTDRQIADPDAAALVYLDTLPKPVVQKGQNVLPQRMNLFGVNDKEGENAKLDKLFKDPMGFMDDEITEILNEEAA